MVPIKPKSTWKTAVMLLIGIIAFPIYLYLFRVDVPEIVVKIQSADTLLYFLAALLVFVDTFLYAMAWHLLLNFLSIKLSILKSYLYVWYGAFMDIIIPAESISGEISRAYLITREQGDGVSGKVAASLVAHRLISMGISVATIAIGTITLLTERHVAALIFNLSVFITAATLLFLALLILLCIKIKWTLKIIDYLIGIVEFIGGRRRELAKIREDTFKVVWMFHYSMKGFGRNPRVIVTSLFLSALSWLSYLSICYIVFLAIGFKEVSFGVILVTQSIVSAVKSIPIGVPFEVGLPEITMTTMYVVLGVPFGTSATATILSRILTLWLRFFVGFIVQQWIEVKAIKTSLNTGKTKKV